MDYTAARNFGFVQKLFELSDTHPIGVASAFCALHERLVDTVTHLGGDLGVELVESVANLRKKVGATFSEDYQSKLKEYRLQQDSSYYTERGYVASQLLEGLKPEPFKAENDLTIDQLKWIIPSLTEAQPTFSLEPRNGEAKEYTPELREAYALKLALIGVPEEKAELKFLIIQELVLARLLGYVPASIMLGYWQSLTPKNEAAEAYHAAVEDALISLPCDHVSELYYIEGGLLLLEALSETVYSASRDWETRVLCQQTTEYINKACNEASDRINHILNNSEAKLNQWNRRCHELINQIKELPHLIDNAEICKHFELGPTELSAYGDNFMLFSEATYIALANC